MASNDCIIDDAYCIKMGAYFQDQGSKLNEMVCDYIAAIQGVRTSAILGGELAATLDSFLEYAQKLKNQVNLISSDAQSQVGAFLNKVDEADQYLF